jgi:N-hydroxyarylamine O-acetyltransferase
LDIDRYLARIRYQGSLRPTVATLHALHEAHILAVPFENLDIGLGRAIKLDQDSLWEKIVERRRGGFCYELNGMFALLLRELGFRVELLSAGVANGSGSFNPDFDHLTLLVHLEEDWLADVGFGESFRLPLRLQPDLAQDQEWGRYRLARDGEDWLFEEWRDAWKPGYRFTLQSRTMSDFSARCLYHQTSPASHFTQHNTCSLATSSGRITLSDMRLITTRHGTREERRVMDQEEYRALLLEHFDIVL